MDLQRRIRTDTILLTAGILLLGYFLGNVLLLVFAAIVLAVGLDGLARAIAKQTPLSREWAFAGIVFVLAAGLLSALGVSAARLVQQFQEVAETVAHTLGRIRTWLAEHGVSGVMGDMSNEDGSFAGSAGVLAGHVMNYGLTAVGAVASVIILVVLTLFLAANPRLYRGGLLRVVPPAHRGIVDNTLSALAHALRWWFLGQLVSMALLGMTVGLGLYVLGIELWFALAVMTALLTFVPFLGPIVAAVPIVAVAFNAGTQTGLIVLIGYLVIQNIEGNVIEPMIQQKAVNLPPALMIAVQVFFSIIFGFVGLMLAAPLTVVAMVSVQKLWVEHTLGEKVTWGRPSS